MVLIFYNLDDWARSRVSFESASAGAWGSPQSAAHDEQEDGQLSGPSLAQTHKT